VAEAKGQKTDLLVFVEEGLDDDDLKFQETFIPEELEKNSVSISEAGKTFFSIPETYSGRLTDHDNALIRRGPDTTSFWKELFSTTGSDHLIRIHGDVPFLDTSILEEMTRLHLEYLAEFTYSDNLPEGFTAEIISRELVDNIPEMKEESLPLSKVIRSNINQFDVELYYRGPDLRDKRISFRSSFPRDRRIMENIAELHGSIPPYEKIRELIEKNPRVLYTGPSYLEVELSGRCDLDCLFCYRNSLAKQRGDMEPVLFKKILTGMQSFKLPYTICFGGSGEPLMHKDFFLIAEAAASESLVDKVIIETNGLYATDELKRFLEKEENKKFDLIINCNGYNEATYKELHGADHFSRILETVTSLLELNGGGNRVHLQIMKIKETEPWLDTFYDFWEEKKAPIILQKQNTFTGRIEDRRYSDLSPLERTPCWHLQRDMTILADGTVPFCRQDIEGAMNRGSLENSSIQEIFLTGKEHFLNDYSRRYPSSPDCRKCDEWYTFNF